MIRKGNSYEEITDKAGTRVVLRFQQEIEPVLQVIEENFNILAKEDKAEQLGYKKVGYQAIHYDVTLRGLAQDADGLDLGGLQCEIQVRTLCQNLWAEMDHQLSYKLAVPVPEDLSRGIYLLNALLEIADRSFSRIRKEIRDLPGAGAMELLQTIEHHFYRLAGESFDPELSQQVIEHITQLYDQEEMSQIHSIIERFVESNSDKLQSIYGQYLKVEDRPLFLFQPEGLLILERLEKDPYALEATWVQKYPREELEQLGIAWGRPLD